MFRKDDWDPFLIISQIFALQSLYYILLGCCFMLFDWLSGHKPSLDQFFDTELLNFSSLFGATTFVSFIVSGLLLFVYLGFIFKKEILTTL